MAFPDRIFDQLHSEFSAALEACRDRPRPKAVHQLRTTARRFEALLNEAKRRQDEDSKFGRKIDRALKALKPIRGAAGPVRDIDVQMELLAEYVDESADGPKIAEEHDELEAEIRKLQAKLRKKRKDASARLISVIEDATDKALRGLDPLRTRLADLEWNSLLKDAIGIQRGAKDLAIADAESLHLYRKRVKFARYLGEMDASTAAEHFAQRMKRVLDAIGAWHDWMLLAQLAKKALGSSSPLAGLLKKERDRSLKRAIRSVDHLRARS